VGFNKFPSIEIKENWKVKMAEDVIAFLLNRGKLVEPHEIKQNWKVKMAEDDIAFLLNRGKPSFLLFRGVQQVPLYLKERQCHPPPS
jgi:hypothetical protein